MDATVLPLSAASLGEVLARRADPTTDQHAYHYLDDQGNVSTRQSFLDLYTQAQRIAQGLMLEQSVGARVLVVMDGGEDYLPTLFGCFLAGQVAVPVYPPQKPQDLESLERVAQLSGAGLILRSRLVSDGLDQLSQFLILNVEDLTHSGVAAQDLPSVDAHMNAIMLFTSGSTGDPKGVPLTHGNFLHNIQAFISHTGCGPGDVLLNWLPHAHVAGLYLRLLGVLTGCRTYLAPPTLFLNNPLNWMKALHAAGASITAGPNAAYEAVARLSPEDIDLSGLSRLRMAICGGEPVREATVDRFIKTYADHGLNPGCFWPYYGLTETVCLTTPAEPGARRVLGVERSSLAEGRVAVTGAVNALRVHSCGEVLPGIDLRIVDPVTLEMCKPGAVGEIWVSSPGNTPGYWQRPELRENVCQALLADEPDKPYFRTGDLGFLNGGELFITGRFKELIIINGRNHYPEDIERTVGTVVSGSSAIAAFSVEAESDERLVVAVEWDTSTEEDARSLLRVVRVRVQAVHGVQVHDLVLLPPMGIPRTTTRKLRRKECARFYADGLWDKVETGRSECAPKESAPLVVQVLSETGHVEWALLDSATPLESLGIDSLTAVQVMTELRRRSGRELPYSLFFDGLTIGGLQAAVEAGAGPTRDDFSADRAEYSRRVAELGAIRSPATPTAPENVLLTGATGFLGGYLLRDLLKRVSGIIYCLVRAESESAGLRRLSANLARSAGDESDDMTRVEVLIGDIGAERLGLSPEHFTALAERIDAVVHNAAGVNFVASYQALKPLNVEPLFPILDFIRTGRAKHLHFVSTLAVFNAPERDRLETIAEGSHIDSPASIFSGYAQSKWMAEQVLRETQKAGLALSLHRPAIVTGDRAGRYFHADDFLSRFIKGCIELGRYPDVNVEIDMTPVDYVAGGIAAMVAKPSPGACYHYANPRPMLLPDVFRWFAGRGYALQAQQLEAWQNDIARNLSTANALFPVAPFLIERGERGQTILEFFHDRPWRFGTDATAAALVPHGLSCPPLDDTLLETSLKGFRRQGFLD